MYKCTECGSEYEIKPDYCECGNDEFETVIQEQDAQIVNSEPIRVEEKPETHIPEQIKTYSAFEEVPLKNRMSSGDILSVGFLILCIILSAIILWIPTKENESLVNEKESITSIVPKNIPSIDKFWNNSVAVAIKNEDTAPKPAVAEVKVAPIQKVVAAAKTPVKTQTVQQSKAASNNTAKKQSTKPAQQTKPAVQNKPQQSTSKPVQNNNTQKPQVSVNSQPSQQVQKQEQTTKSSTQTQVSQSGSGTTTVTLNKNPDVSTVEQANNATVLKQELSNYKAALRNTIGRKIDFTKVVGDGSCSVAFKIDSSGRLINRSFSKQSSNMTLNDAVYAAVMATPSYEAPPAGYKGENLTLNIRFFNGNFEISLY